MEPLVKVQDLQVMLSGRQVLEGVSFTLPAGSFTALLGPNGAGKTTLLRALLGLVRARGEVQVPEEIGYVPQRHEFRWDFPITVREAVATGRTRLFRPLRAPDWQASDQALAQVGLLEFATRPVGLLSGGQRQRVLLARALVRAPELLLLDEPLTGLDAPNQDRFMQLCGSLAQGGATVLMSTHDLPQAVECCEQLLLLKGQIIAAGAPAQLRTAQPWMHTFGVGENSALLRAVGVVPA